MTRAFALAALAVVMLGACARTRDGETGSRPIAACDSSAVRSLAIAGARVTSVSRVAAGSLAQPGIAIAAERIPAFCRVHAQTSAGPGSIIGFEVWVPERTAWNGKLVATGNGGYSAALSYNDMAMLLRRGYAVVGGDTGHGTDDSKDLRFVVGHPERIEDWGSRSIHAIIGPAKALVAALQGRDVRRAYFYGCSTGGQQAFAEMQRYPQDFDGVIAGAPGFDRVRLNAGFLWQYRANHAPGDDGTPILTPANLLTVTRAVIAACDTLDGVRDFVLGDPRACTWSPRALRCGEVQSADCLTPQQIEAVEKMYAGARNPRTGEQVYPGWPRGSEAPVVSSRGGGVGGWNGYWGTTEPARAGFWRYWVFNDSTWNWWRFDFDDDLRIADERVGRVVDQTSTDLAAFKRRGGKAIVYQGWADPVVSALGVVAYYERLRAREGSQRAIDEYFRLFMVPGMAHCVGGQGAVYFGNAGFASPFCDAQHDLVEALDRWVEKGVAPERIVASQYSDEFVTGTRPLCPYPRRATYLGRGSTDDASNFACRS